jgi:hypothetical protein
MIRGFLSFLGPVWFVAPGTVHVSMVGANTVPVPRLRLLSHFWLPINLSYS